MESRIHVITLAVRDLDRALEFYRSGLGLDSPGIVGTEFTGEDDDPAGAVAMFRLDGGLVLALYPRTELAKDADVPVGAPTSGEFSLGHLVARRDDVDALLAQAETAGAKPTGPAHDRPWGIYSGYFRDLDGTPLGDHLEPADRAWSRLSANESECATGTLGELGAPAQHETLHHPAALCLSTT
jgi:uncharacterized protein